MASEIVIRDLDKYYGKKQALKKVTLKMESGMFGLLGPNGAGKTTLMKVLATLLRKSNGRSQSAAFLWIRQGKSAG